jgi:hypothetical protein
VLKLPHFSLSSQVQLVMPMSVNLSHWGSTYHLQHTNLSLQQHQPVSCAKSKLWPLLLRLHSKVAPSVVPCTLWEHVQLKVRLSHTRGGHCPTRL